MKISTAFEKFPRAFYFLSFKTDKILQWVVERKNFENSGPLGRFSYSRYWEESHQAIHPMGLTSQGLSSQCDSR